MVSLPNGGTTAGILGNPSKYGIPICTGTLALSSPSDPSTSSTSGYPVPSISADSCSIPSTSVPLAVVVCCHDKHTCCHLGKPGPVNTT